MKRIKFYKRILEGYISKGYIDCPIRRKTVKIVRAIEVYNLRFVTRRFANIINLWIIVQDVQDQWSCECYVGVRSLASIVQLN